MSSTRRDFIQRSATAAAAFTLGAPLGLEAGAEPHGAPAPSEVPSVAAFEEKMLRARPVALNKTRVNGGPLKRAQELDGQYLLSLDPDRMLAYYRERAGLPKKAEPYAGWDGGGRNLTGHIAGHHLSAVSLMYAATGDARFKDRADYIVRELKVVQDKNGDGYLSAIDIGRQAFGELQRGVIRSAAFDLNGMWSPWYTLHKTFAGLRDAYRYTGNKTALGTEAKFAAWAEGILEPLSDDQVQHMLNTEHGGMNEVLADLYADTGDKRWLALSYRFEHRAFTDALKRHQDNLSGKHVNCQMPKIIGSAARYGYVADPADMMAAAFFWDRVTQHHTYAAGGQGLAEYFGPPDVLGARVDGRTCESCNVYNMLKLTRRMFSFAPDAHYADFQERALFNHALSSMDLDDGRTSYMVPVGRGVQQEYQNMLESFTCCVGTGMENHALHGYGIYYESPDTVWVTQFVPSSAELSMHGARIAQETSFPDGDWAKLTLAVDKPKTFTLAVRRPVWAGDAFAVKVNGQTVEQPALATLRDGAAGGRANAPGNEDVEQSSVFVNLEREWKTGDTVELTIPKTLRLEPTPDNKTVAAIMWGPLVLAGDWGPRVERRREGQQVAVPVLVAADRPVADWVVSDGAPGNYRAQQVAKLVDTGAAAPDVSLKPFYRTDGRTYSVYFDVISQQELAARSASIAAAREHMRKLEAATVGSVQIGQQQAEHDANYQSDPANRPPTRNDGRTGRGGPGWFSYDLPVDPNAPTALVVTYFNDLGLPPSTGDFEVMVDGTSVAHFQPNSAATGFFETTYAVPSALTSGKSKVTVRFQANGKGRVAPVFGVRTIRANAM
jgi:uncharacterized protein